MPKTQKITFSPKVKEVYSKNYGLVLNHSGVQICSWNKKALRNQGVCYKQIFYGVDCHRCAQMSPSLVWCQQNCIFCWRQMEWMKKIKMKPAEVDDPEEIINETIKQRKKLIVGIKGAYDSNQILFKEAYEKFPSHWAISLSGEPTIYPKLGELISRLEKNKEVRSIFLVTNGQEPEHLLKLSKTGCLPTQLYLSLDAPNKILFDKINKSLYRDGWKRLNKTLKYMAKFNCRRVIRFTLIKGLNDNENYLKNYAGLFEKSKTDFIEIKAYMFLGLSRERLKIENMPYHEDVVGFSKKLALLLKNYRIINEHPPSRIVLFKRKDSKYEDIIRKR
ncbi:MAG: 4-demethylwyosine synthase TYW1 [Candidatus Paceibacterota bacterium]|jgi:tRNA wybutosine-synthesizing protein 1